MIASLRQALHSFYQSRTGYTLGWLTVYALVLLLASSIFFYTIPLPENSVALRDIQYAISDAETPEALTSVTWREGRLPHQWKQTAPEAMNVWYRGVVELPAEQHVLWGIFIPALRMNAAVYLNGELLGDGGRFADPVARNWMTPLLFSIPAGLLKTSGNTIHIRVKSDPPGTGQLAALQLAPYDDLAYAYRAHYLFRITSIQIITAMLLVMGAFIALLWLVRRKESYYGYYALAVIIWGLHNFNIFITTIPVSTRVWDWMAFVSIGYYTFAAFIFTHRFLEIEHPRLEKTVLATGMIASLLLLLPDDKLFYFAAYNLWYPAVFTLGLYILAYTCKEAWKRQSMELQLLTAVGAITLLYALHDLLLMHGYVDWQDGYYIQYAAAVLLTLFSFILLRRFIKSLNEVDELNRTLEKRIDANRRQLQNNFQQLRQMENEQILARERERLAREIHDGMGGHLVSTLAMIHSGNASLPTVANAIQDSLNDLRLMIDSMDISENDLETLLGMFRSRITPRLDKCALSLSWHIEDLPPLKHFGPREALHILRILQETVSNSIKHAQADRLSLVARALPQGNGDNAISIELSDNGCGMTDDRQDGRGLKNMRYRAQKIGACLNIDSDATGTRVQLLLAT